MKHGEDHTPEHWLEILREELGLERAEIGYRDVEILQMLTYTVDRLTKLEDQVSDLTYRLDNRRA